jgi:para-nitrobenzyl esterase
VARASAMAGGSTWLYHFTHRVDGWILPNLGAFHSAELPFVFDNTYVTYTISGPEIALSMSMQGYWTRFAAAGDPNGSGAVTWPKYDVAGDQDLTLDLTIVADTHLDQAHCDFWDPLYP